jgi:D-alanyl-D-alanine carboxypeptidase (penicillin-binding protein 5/6)
LIDLSGPDRIKRRPLQDLASVVGVLLLVAASPLPAAAPTAYADAARSYLVVRDDQVVWEREPTLELQPASLTKLLTALVVLDSDWDADRWLPVSAAAAGAAPTRLGLRKGEEVTAGAAMAAMLIKSANDACRVLVDGAAPDLVTFTQRMNQRAKSLGMTKSRFIDPCGFDAPGQHSTVTDLLKLAQAARRSPLIARLAALPRAQLKTRAGRVVPFTNTNQLLGRLEGAAGMKTGYTAQAGQCLIAYARRADHEVWLVMLGGTQRWWQAHGMIDDAFNALPGR